MKNTTIETITPKQAATWLGTVNRDNRPLRQSHVQYLAREILAGRWQVTHQGIAFAKGGPLIDGQHRLSAIVLAGKAVQMMVTTGLSDDVFLVTDSGMKRTHYDRIHLVDDYAENKVICEVITCYVRETVRRGIKAVSVGEIEDEFLKRTEAYMWVGHEFRVKPLKLGKAGVLASFAIYHTLNAKRAMEFCSGYKTGAGLTLRSPILALRKYVLGQRGTEVNYWRAQAAMRAHLQGRELGIIAEISEDMLGQSNTGRVVKALSESRKKGAETRRAQLKSA